jgi:carnitine O-acetyltransferase
MLLRSIYSSPLRRIQMVPSIRTARHPWPSIRLEQPSKTGGRWKSSTPVEKLVPIRPWGTTMVESNGEYREEMWIEDHVGGPLYQYQKTLPSLPVPEIPATMERLVPTVIPLVKNSAEQEAFSNAIRRFPQQAAALQVRLLQRAADIGTTSSWLQQWWNTWCYLQVRDPVVINVSYFFHFANDPTARTLLQRGASLLTTVAQFRHAVATGQFPAEVIGKGDQAKPLCSVAYKYMFNACRIPQLHQDAYRIYDPALHHHVIVAVRGQFFKVPLVDPVTWQPHSIPALEAALQGCIDQATTNNGALPLGWCTSSNRDTWANARRQLLETGGLAMEEALKDLESGAVLLCLDIDDTVVSRSEIAELLLHGSGKGNRWFDKSVQLIVSANGKAGLLGEHSMMDGMPVVQLANHITKTTYSSCLQSPSTDGTQDQRLEVTPVFSASLYDKIRTTAEPLIEQGVLLEEDRFLLLYDNFVSAKVVSDDVCSFAPQRRMISMNW